MTYLTYIGTGFLQGVPARDLTREEAEQYNVKELLASGLYQLQDKQEYTEKKTDKERSK